MENNFKFPLPATFEGGRQCKNHFIDAFRPMLHEFVARETRESSHYKNKWILTYPLH